MKMLGSMVLLGGLAGMGVMAFPMIVKVFENLTSSHSEGSTTERLFHTYKEAFKSVGEKIDQIQALDEENRKLKLENVNLRRWAEALRYDCSKDDALKRSREIGNELTRKTGVRMGRFLASVDYAIPKNLLPNQLLTLGVSYFKAGEYEKSAVIFTFLTNLEDTEIFKSSRNYLIAGVSWYHLDNLKEADQFFDLSLQSQATPQNRQYHAQARLWKAIVAERLQNHASSQYWMTQLVDYHPHSVEASWVNRLKRMPASEQKKLHQKNKSHEVKSHETQHHQERQESSHGH